MTSRVNGDMPSAKEKALTVVAGVGVFWLSWGVLGFLYVLLPLIPPDFLWVQSGDVSVLSPRAFLSYFAVLLAAMFVGWSLPTKGSVYGVVTGVCTQLPGVGPSFIAMTRLSLDLWRNPDMIFAGAGSAQAGITQLWLVTVLMPLTVAVAVGAVGGFCGRRLHQRLRSPSRTHLARPGQEDCSS